MKCNHDFQCHWAYNALQSLKYGSVFRTSGKKKLLICPGKIIILPGQDKNTLICPGKIIILPRQDNHTLSCPGKLIILPGQDNHTLSWFETMEFIRVYFTLGFSQKEILRCLAMNHGVIISSRHLRRVLRQHGLTLWKGKTILPGQINV